MRDGIAGEPGPSRAAATKGPQQQFVGFRLDGTDYAISILRIREIILMRPITRLPQVPTYVEGLINLRGTVIPIVSLRKRFGLAHREIDEDTRTIVVTIGEKTVGCIVDEVTKVLRVEADALRPPPISLAAGARRHIAGLARQDDRLLILLDLDALLDADELDTDSLAPAASLAAAGSNE
jgi:purine-binding chemotaxis protein CheW